MNSRMPSIVKTRSGKIEGTYLEGIYTFKGIPYAAPPVGPAAVVRHNRWIPGSA